MERPNYENIGNLREDYKHQPRTVRPQGLITTPSLVLKLYSMAKDMHPQNRTIRDTRRLLERDITEGKINPLTGLGFAILSEDMLNVARWDAEYPIVVKNQIYGFEESINSAQLLDTREVGSFCVWELGIVGHEKEAWKRFLDSQRGEAEKYHYLNDVIEGSL
ncbi:MAG: hypothetical protein ABIE36_00530 [Candidatus Diapherotrites archaeon]